MYKLLLAYFLLLTITACNNETKPTVDATDAETVVATKDSASAIVYTLDSTASSLQWEGYEGLSLGKSEHNGTLKINAGKISIVNTIPVAGKFSISISSLKVNDIPASKPGNAKLTKHLLSADFFDAAKYPEASFEITNAVANGTDSMNITGNLTLKGISKSITIPAFVKISDNIFTATTPKFYINRKDWEMHYRSENSLGDEMIRNEMGVIINLTAKK
jgi:polyisoprenoid-binding protein YceI